MLPETSRMSAIRVGRIVRVSLSTSFGGSSKCWFHLFVTFCTCLLANRKSVSLANPDGKSENRHARDSRIPAPFLPAFPAPQGTPRVICGRHSCPVAAFALHQPEPPAACCQR